MMMRVAHRFLLLAMAAAIVACVGCGKDSGVYHSGILPPSDSQAESSTRNHEASTPDLLPVVMSPQEPASDGEKVALAAPLQLLPQLPRLEKMSEVDADGKDTSTVTRELLPPQLAEPQVAEVVSEEGADFAPWLPHEGVTTVDVHAVFQPEGEKPAYAVYRFNLSDYDGAPTIKFCWEHAPTDLDNLWTAFANFEDNTWDWYRGPDDFVLTIPGYEPYVDREKGCCLLVVALLGTDTATLTRLSVGASELRAIGAEPANELSILLGVDMGVVPELNDDDGALPASADLSSDCAPVNDQKSWAACTAFAVGDGAFNYELNRIYSRYGWDLDDASYRVSPKYLYVVSGELQGWPPGSSYYRNTSQVVRDLENHGVATEYEVPFDLKYNNDWSAEALADAELLDIEDWDQLHLQDEQDLCTMKMILADRRIPVVVRMEIDQSFLVYKRGRVWDYSGPSKGGHAMLVVGYDDSLQAFKVRNSWGRFWGYFGHVWIGYETFLNRYAYVRCWTIEDEYDPAVVERFLGPETLLPTPTGIQASDGIFEERVLITWTPSDDARGYLISRDSVDYVVAETGRVDRWVDTSVYSDVEYVYWVRATDGERVSYESASDTGFAK